MKTVQGKSKNNNSRGPSSAYPSPKHTAQLLVPCRVSRINYRCLILHCKIWQRLMCGKLGSQAGFQTLKTAVGKSVWGGSQRGTPQCLPEQKREAGVSGDLESFRGCTCGAAAARLRAGQPPPGCALASALQHRGPDGTGKSRANERQRPLRNVS